MARQCEKRSIGGSKYISSQALSARHSFVSVLSDQMLVFDDSKLILMLPQKCGTTTIENRLTYLHNAEVRPHGLFFDKRLNKYLSKHINLKDAQKLDWFRKRRHYAKACFVRNPYERAYSWFLWQLRQLEINLPEGGRADSAQDAAAFPSDGDAEAQRTHRLMCHLKSKMETANWTLGGYLKISAKTYRPVSNFTHRFFRNQMQFIGYVERFEEDYEKLLERFSIKGAWSGSSNASSIPHVYCNPLDMKPEDYRYLEFLDRQTVEQVNTIFKKDFKYYGYRILDPKTFPEQVVTS